MSAYCSRRSQDHVVSKPARKPGFSVKPVTLSGRPGPLAVRCAPPCWRLAGLHTECVQRHVRPQRNDLGAVGSARGPPIAARVVVVETDQERESSTGVTDSTDCKGS